MPFSGFSKDTVAFLRELEKHNEKVWFDANKERLERVWLEPARHFVVEAGERIKKFAPSIQYEPKIGGSLMRMNRDIRFSEDKSPYKTHFDCFFWDGDDKGWGRPGFFFRLTRNELMCGAGIHSFEKDALAKYRAAVADPKSGPVLAKLVQKLREGGVDVGRQDLKKVPKGFDAEHPRGELLRFGGLHAGRTTKVPAELESPAFVKHVAARFQEVENLRRWLADVLD